MGEVVRRANIVAPYWAISFMPSSALKVRSWQNGVAPKTQDAVYAALEKEGLFAESVFDAAHGRRYLLFVYLDAAGRKACWDFLTGYAPSQNEKEPQA